MIRYFIVIFAAVFLVPAKLFAQTSVDTTSRIITPADRTKPSPEEMKQKLQDFIKNEKQVKDSVQNPKLILPPYNSDPRLDSVQLSAWQNYYGYMSHGYQHRNNVFSWQLFSSKLIFFMVIFLVLMGIYFAWLQFMYVIHKRKDGKSVGEELQTELTASGKEIKISSPVLGVIILLISLMFFFLYLKYVYPIIESF